MPQRRWSLASPDAGAVEVLCREAGLRPQTAAVLLNRGVDGAEAAKRFLEPRLADLTPPDRLPDTGAAADRLARAVTAGERIALFGDYDVDGITSTVLLLELLRDLGAEVSYEIPDRAAGYGLSTDAVERAVADGAKLLVTVDCGTSAREAVAAAGRAGLDVIVTDHHQITDALPEAAAVVNPQRDDGSGAGRELAGVGVAMHLAMALRARLRELGFFGERVEPNLKAVLDLVALGTIADVVPLTGENRILVAVGLQVLGRTRRPGLSALLEVSGVRDPASITARDVAFRLAPRLNAAGRMGDPSRGVELLAARDKNRARAMAADLDEENRRRRQEQDRLIAEAGRLLGEAPEERMALVVTGDGWPRGLVGLVAGRLADRHRRPAVVFSCEGGRCVGSARSVPPLNLHDALGDCGGLMLEWGGHAEAAGMTLESSRVDEFGEALERAVAARVSKEELREELHLDATLSPGELDEALIDELTRLAPHGAANPAPLFLVRDVVVKEAWTMGRDGATLGLRLGLADGREVRCVGFGQGHRRPPDGSHLDLAARPVRNEFRGERRLELIVEDLREAGA